MLAGVAARSLTVAHLNALADAVLETEAVRLATEVRAGGPFAVRRALELAALVLAADHAEVLRPTSSSP